MEFLGQTTDNGVTVKSYWDNEQKRYWTDRTDHASAAAKASNRETQKDGKRRYRPGDGEYTIFRMSHDDRKALAALYPDLEHPDPNIRTEAWNRLRYSPLSRPFQMTRPPGRDKVSFSSKPAAPSLILPR